MLIEYKFFEPAFYSTDIPDWGMAYCLCLKLGPQAQVLVDLGHHAQGVNIEQIVGVLLDEGRLGGFHFNNRKYADDDLIVGSVNPVRAVPDLQRAGRRPSWSDDEPVSTTAKNVAYMIDQCHNIEGKMARHDPVGDELPGSLCQGADRRTRTALAELQAGRRGAGRHTSLLTDAFRTDVRPLLAQVREEMGVPVDPIAAYRASGYEEKMRKERGTAKPAAASNNHL